MIKSNRESKIHGDGTLQGEKEYIHEVWSGGGNTLFRRMDTIKWRQKIQLENHRFLAIIVLIDSGKDHG